LHAAAAAGVAGATQQQHAETAAIDDGQSIEWRQ